MKLGIWQINVAPIPAIKVKWDFKSHKVISIFPFALRASPSRHRKGLNATK